MTLVEAKKDLEKFVELKTTLRPTFVDVLLNTEEVKHGHWNDKSVAFYRKCSECGCCVEWDKKPFLFGKGDYNYCPNCGAKMDEVSV
jgi:hypothetical protein